MNPIFKTLIYPILKKLINYAFSKAEDYAIEKFVEMLDKDKDGLLSPQELKEYKTMISYIKKYKYSSY